MSEFQNYMIYFVQIFLQFIFNYLSRNKIRVVPNKRYYAKDFASSRRLGSYLVGNYP